MRKVFKAVIPLVLAVALSAVYGCTGMVQDELDATHAKLEALQKRVQEANRQIADLNAVLAALDNSKTILSKVDYTEDGYTITFTDGQTVHIHYGVDGVDGKAIIPVGVQFEDGHYYWQVDGQWLLDADGNRIRIDAADGEDGIAPQVKVEDGFWWISTDDGHNWEKLSSCEEMDGVGVFSGYDTSDPSCLALVLWDGTRVEIPYYVPMNMAFSGSVLDTLLIAGGELLTIPYEVLFEGEVLTPVTVTSGTDGVYFSRVIEGDAPGKGSVQVQAPQAYSEGYILLTAWCDGYSAVKMISFLEREIPVKELTVRTGSGEGTRDIPYPANFEFTVSEPDADWLEVVADPESGTVSFRTTKPNQESTVRKCTVKVFPKDNPGFVCTTFTVMQATDSRTIYADPPFSISSDGKTLTVPAEGGEADIWITDRPGLARGLRELPVWCEAEMSFEDGFYRLHLRVDALESEDPREGILTYRLNIFIYSLKIVQK